MSVTPVTTSAAETNPSSEALTPTAPKSINPRARIARQILVYHFILIFASGVYYLMRGFDLEEFTSLIGILAPITAMYGGAVFRYIGRSITEPILNHNNSKAPINNLVRWLVHGHFAAVMLLISLKALAPNILNFRDMVIFLTLIESALGVYMGNIILALFEPPQPQQAQATKTLPQQEP
ncbi:MAG: hypothetical protein NZM43_05395 [Saprospiraceae bacterium]|nr:hypothetical protein [Saprospiraceae bacterium]MDW8483743.1 hypothetical protein [Saprospiraceae bacterium]